ncbi:MAG: protein kinase [Planctomycetota bacterium]
MKESESKTCDKKLIELFLNDQLEESAHDRFSLHLEDCQECRHALVNQAAEPNFWTEASMLLAESDSLTSETGESFLELEEELGVKPSVQSILDWLSPTDDPEMLGRVGEYEISGVVGIGGMGAVLKGFDKSLLRVVAIKVMASHLAHAGSARQRFQREAHAAASISHDNVIEIYQVAEANGIPYLVMPYARGSSLQKRIEEGGPLSTIEVVQVGRQIASGLASAHDQGLVHRDIKPANILLNDVLERVLISDFGVARVMDDVSMTRTGLIAGTPQFMSPEQARGESVDYRSDLFSLGAVLYTACTGRPPFRADTPFGVLRKITDTQPKPIREINPEIPGWLECFVLTLLNKDRMDRFGNAADIAAALEKCLAHLHQPHLCSLPDAVVQLQPGPVEQLKKHSTGADGRNSSRSTDHPRSTVFKRLRNAMLLLSLGALSIFAFLQFAAAPDITGNWEGEAWQNIQLSSVQEADDWYTGSFINTSGDKGSIHLEWSAVRQRYTGRWSTNSTKQSGTIVLRVGNVGTVRGAIALDSDVPTNAGVVRLRDFEWTVSDGAALDKTQPVADNRRYIEKPNETKSISFRNIISPVNGTIKSYGKKIGKGDQVKQGDLIVEIQTNGDDQVGARLKDCENRLDLLKALVEACERNVSELEKARDYSVASSQELAEAAKSKYESKQRSIPAYEAKKEQAEINYTRTEKLYDRGAVSAKEAEKMKKDLKVAQAELDSARAEVKSLESNWKAKLLEIDENNRVGDSKIEYASAMRQNALTQIEKVSKEIAELKTKRNQLERCLIRAPIDGIVDSESVPQINSRVKEGDVILKLHQAKPAEPQSNPLDSMIPRDSRRSTTESSGQSFEFQMTPGFLKLVSDSKRRIQEAESKRIELQNELRQISGQISTTKKNLVQHSRKAEDGETSQLDGKKLEQLTQELESYQRLSRQLKQSIEVNAENVESAKRELDTLTEVLRLELQSKESELEKAERLAKLHRLQFEQGDITGLELLKAEAPTEVLATQIKQLKQIIRFVDDDE